MAAILVINDIKSILEGCFYRQLEYIERSKIEFFSCDYATFEDGRRNKSFIPMPSKVHCPALVRGAMQELELRMLRAQRQVSDRFTSGDCIVKKKKAIKITNLNRRAAGFLNWACVAEGLGQNRKKNNSAMRNYY